MKYLTALFIIFSACNSGKTGNDFIVKKDTVIFTPKHKIDYHIKALHYGRDKYQLVFTNDNWESQQNIMTAFDISSTTRSPNVVHQLYLGECEEIKQFAKQFDSYEKCILYNLKVEKEYQRLVKFREANPIKEVPFSANIDQPVCEKEIIIY